MICKIHRTAAADRAEKKVVLILFILQLLTFSFLHSQKQDNIYERSQTQIEY